MLKLIVIALALSLLSRWVLGKWPWNLLKPPGGQGKAVSRARRLLGVSKDASPYEIREAHRRLVAQVHPDKGGSNEAVHEANEARDLLLGEPPHLSDPR